MLGNNTPAIAVSSYLSAHTCTTSSQVYKVLGPNLRLFALKVVSWKGSNSKEMVRGFKEEFAKLKSLRDSPGVINVYDLEEFPEEKMLLMCLQLGDIDLAKLLKNKRAEWAVKGITDPFVADPTFICALWHDMLRAVQVRVVAVAVLPPQCTCIAFLGLIRTPPQLCPLDAAATGP